MSEVRSQALVSVYNFSHWSEEEQDNLISRYKATEETIAARGAELIPDSGEDVPEEALDEDGLYDPDSAAEG